MSYKIRLHPLAEAEFHDSMYWYQRQQKGLELEFARCIDEAIERIKRTPELYPRTYKHIRKIVVRRFPFIILYEFDDNEIRIIAIFHSRRNPKTIEKRT